MNDVACDQLGDSPVSLAISKKYKFWEAQIRSFRNPGYNFSTILDQPRETTAIQQENNRFGPFFKPREGATMICFGEHFIGK